MPDTVADDCGGTLELDHAAQSLDHDPREHIDPYYVVGWITRQE